MFVGFRYLVATLCLGLFASNATQAQSDSDYSDVRDRVAELKNTLPDSTQDNSFQVEQEEFEKMRQQLIEAENNIVKEASNIDANEATSMLTGDSPLDEAFEKPADATTKQKELTLKDASDTIPGDKGYTISTVEVTPPKKNKSSDKIALLEQELQDARNKLLVAEAEIERLNNLISNQKSPQPLAKNDSALVFSTAYGDKESTEDENYDLVITVVADKTSLRGSPDKSAMRIMELSKGARLKVEDRQGDWFRISTKSGTRAWVSAKDVAFGPTDSASPTSTVRIRPIAIEQRDEEARAFDLIKNHSKNK